MSSEKARLEIGHVLFIDIVGYSKLLLKQQGELLRELNEIVSGTQEFRQADSAGKLMRLPTGDGMALVFRTELEAPLECALEIATALRDKPSLQVRMGIHSGPVSEVADVNERANIAGAGINVAQRVMDCGDVGHILLSRHVAEVLEQDEQWEKSLHDLGECEVKHGARIHLFNFYTDEAGNSQLPQKLRAARRKQLAAARRRYLVAGVAVVLVALAALVFYRARESGMGEAISKKSIAVLPFENFSADKNNAFFADGIQDDILTSLARIHDLKVISRSSVMQFRDVGARNLREIGKVLSVASILEGSVRREGSHVVVNVQLIDALHDRHMWANRYDRTLADSLGLQGELAAEIADALRVTLSPDEKARVEKKPTENADAYLVYLQANQVERNPDTLLEDFKKAGELYKRAILLDQDFALAHARLASTCAQIFHFYEPIESWRTEARSEAELALQLQPNLAEAHVALGQCIYWIDGDYDRAVEQFEQALRFSPNNADVGELLAAVKRREGRWSAALEAFERAQKIDPQNPNIVRNIVFTLTALRRWPEAADWAARMRAMAPASLVAKIQSGYVDFWWKGDSGLLKSLLSQVPEGIDPDGQITSARWDVAMIERNYGAAREILEKSPASDISYTNEGATPKSFLMGCVEKAQGDNVAAQKSFEMARPVFEKAVEEAPESAARHANLGWFYAFSGRKDDAIREGRRAVELKPESKDAFDGAGMNCYLALIYARVGEKDLAFPLIERLLKTPGAVDSVNYSITVNDLKYRWEWDPIRSDPRFARLVNSPIGNK